MREITDGNALYEAFRKSMKNSDWKEHVQRFEANHLIELSRIQQALQNDTYEFSKGNEFVINERGKTRPIVGELITDRIVKHVLCDEIINPTIKRYLIYDNGASQEGKGVDFTRQRLLTHLRRYYMNNGSNEGYILLGDFSKFYDNIIHKVLRDQLAQYITDTKALSLVDKILKGSEVDVSYMSEEEYANCMDKVFNALEHWKIDKSLLTGKRFLAKHLNIGDQFSQSGGVLYPTPIDNYVKIVRGVKGYGIYMDDFYAIHRDKEFLIDLRENVIRIANELGITLNRKKTRICKLSEAWRFLQVQYSLTETGRVIQKINPKRITTMRRKIKKLSKIMSRNEFTDYVYEWWRSNYKYMSRLQRKNFLALFVKLKEETNYDESGIIRRHKVGGIYPEWN